MKTDSYLLTIEVPVIMRCMSVQVVSKIKCTEQMTSYNFRQFYELKNC